MSVMKNIPHPIQYQGSKRNLASVILRYVPKGGIERLVEPFAGSAAISIAAAARQIAKSYVINDLNKPLMELLGVPDDKVVAGAILMGYPKVRYKNIVERNALEVTFDED